MFSRIMLGGNIFGYLMQHEETKSLLKLAKEHGITSIDTADVYSNGESESIIGKITKEDRKSWYIATKVGLRSRESPSGLGRKKIIFRKLEDSLRRLQTDYIDLYQMHHFDPDTPLEETIEAFSFLKEKGVIRDAGIANYSLGHLEELEGLQHPMLYHQIPFTITAPDKSLAMFEKSQNMNLSIVAYSVLSRGLFNEKYLQGIPASSRASMSENVRSDLTQDFLNKLNACVDICQRDETTLLEIALHWTLQFDYLRWAIIGVRNSDQLASLVKAVKKEVSTELINACEDIWQIKRPDTIKT